MNRSVLFRHRTGTLLMVIILMAMSSRAVAARYAKVSKAWIEHNVTLAGRWGMRYTLISQWAA